jgi:ferredoxin
MVSVVRSILTIPACRQRATTPLFWYGRPVTSTSTSTRTGSSAGIRPFSSRGNEHEDVTQYLEKVLEIDPKLHDGILKNLEYIYGKDIRVNHLDSFGKTAMEALAKSVQQELLRKIKRTATATGTRKKRPSIPIRIKIPHHSKEFDLEWKLGDSLLDLAKISEDLLGEYMEGTCGGTMSCCTCHVYIEQPKFSKLLDEPEELELDMLVRP